MKKYILVSAVALAVYFFISFFLPSGGIVIDSLSYFGIASDLPLVKTNLFPLGFPVFIETFNLIFKDYFWASKTAVILLLLAILLFSYFKKFYFRETVLLCICKTFLFIFTGVFSESLFIFLLYFLIYYIKKVLEDEIRNSRNALISAFILILMFTVRYSAIYIVTALWIFLILNLIKNRKKFFIKSLLIVTVISSIGISLYLLLNYHFFASFTGEHLRGKPAQILPIDIFRNILGMMNAANPYIGIKPASNSILSLSFQVVLFFVDLILLHVYFKYLRKSRGDKNFPFHSLLLIISLTYIITLFLSGFVQQIEELNVRMLAPANVCLFFSFLILYFKYEKMPKKIFVFGCSFFLFMIFYSLKNPANYLANRAEIIRQMKKFKNKKYLFNDETSIKNYTEYRFPLINKTVKYEHGASHPGNVKMNIVGTVNPQIKWILNDTVKKKSEVLYTSELKLK
jgi:hypothetical protein